MKRLTKSAAVIALMAVSACTATPEMIAAQKDRCTAVGYQPGTIEHAQCAERGTAQQQATQNAAAGGAASAAVTAAILHAFF